MTLCKCLLYPPLLRKWESHFSSSTSMQRSVHSTQKNSKYKMSLCDYFSSFILFLNTVSEYRQLLIHMKSSFLNCVWHYIKNFIPQPCLTIHKKKTFLNRVWHGEKKTALLHIRRWVNYIILWIGTLSYVSKINFQYNLLELSCRNL